MGRQGSLGRQNAVSPNMANSSMHSCATSSAPTKPYSTASPPFSAPSRVTIMAPRDSTPGHPRALSAHLHAGSRPAGAAEGAGRLHATDASQGIPELRGSPVRLPRRPGVAKPRDEKAPITRSSLQNQIDAARSIIGLDIDSLTGLRAALIRSENRDARGQRSLPTGRGRRYVYVLSARLRQ